MLARQQSGEQGSHPALCVCALPHMAFSHAAFRFSGLSCLV